MNNKRIQTLTLAIGAAFVGSLAVAASAQAFSVTDLDAGYHLVGDKDAEGKCGEGKCGDKKAEGKCGDKKAEGKCGDKKAEGSCGGRA